MVILATVCLLGGIYFLLIQTEKEQNIKLAHEANDKKAELDKINTSIKQGTLTDQKLTDITSQLQHAEDDVVTGDVYAWVYDTVRHFKANYHVDIPNIGQPTVNEVDMLGAFPYKQVTVSLSGTAYYHDLGKFISDFENNFQHIRMVNLSIEPANAGGTGATVEKLSFRVDLVALVKPNT